MHFRHTTTFLAVALHVCVVPLQAQSDTAQNIGIHAYTHGGKLHFATDDQAFHWWLDNRIYIDGACYMPTHNIDELTSKTNSDLEDDDGTFRFSNGVVLRRARMAVKADLYKNWFAELDLDFAYNELNVKDMYIGYRFSERLSVKAGQFKEPMSIESTTSSKYLQSVERPMPVDIFASGRHLGLSLTAWGNGWWASGGIFGSQVDLIQKERNRGDDGWAVTARAAVSPVHSEATTVHVGGYATRRTPDANGNENRSVEFRGMPESRVDRRRFVDAVVDNVNSYYTLGYELAFRHRKWLLFGEYVFTSVDRYDVDSSGKKSGSFENCTFNGWYANASYMIIGQARQYAADEAEFGPMPVEKKCGNLEVAAHYSTVNLNDFHDFSSIVTGGEAQAYSLSVNWFPNANLLVSLNYTYIDNDKYADAKGHVKCNGQALSEAFTSGVDFSIVQMRIMASF